MSFDRLASHYRWMEWLLAGEKLQRCRTAHLKQLLTPMRTLLLGEGHGRFIVEFLRQFPGAQVSCVDSSRQMISETQRRLKSFGADTRNVQFIVANILEWQPTPSSQFDLVVSNFFLDCFQPEQLQTIVQKISVASTPGARWLIADFCEPPRGLAKWRARAILKSMYWFFQLVTNLPADKLTCPAKTLQKNDFRLIEQRTFEWGLLHADIWVKNKHPATL